MPSALASPTAVMAVSPSDIFNPGLGPGSTFRVDITIADVSNLWGYQFTLWYSTAILTATDFGFYPPLQTSAPSWIDDAAGTVDICETSYYGDPVGVTFVDPWSVAWIEFVVDSIGPSSLDLRNTILVDCWAGAISHVSTDGFFSNVSTVPEFPFGVAIEFALSLGVAFVMLQKKRSKT